MNISNKSEIIEALPVFPLKSVLFPGGALSLKVFEARYLKMLSQCEKEGSDFGICLIKEGCEVGAAATIFTVGTLVQVTFWEQRKDGLLGISIKGKKKFKVLKTQVLENQLIVADVQLLGIETEQNLPEQYLPMVEVLKNIFSALRHPYITLAKKYDDSSWVSARLSELLPISTLKKQQLLEMSEPMARLAMLYDEMLNLGLLSE
jgi:uncharacterized protein